MSSYILYTLTVLIASIFGDLSQRYSQINNKGYRVPNKILWLLSASVLIFTMGFREYTIGVDGLNYIEGYNLANSLSFSEYYSTRVTEPGFYLLYRIVNIIFNDYQGVFIVSSIITIAFFYKAFSYEINNISLGLTIFIFASTQYFYYFGIMRMGISVSIIAMAYRYILQNEERKYILFVFLATLFHYSALFALAALFIRKNKFTNKFNERAIIKILILVPLTFYGVRFLIYPLIGVSRYQKYIDATGSISLGFLTSSLPFLLLFLLFYKKMSKKHENFQFYFFLFIIKFVTEIFAPIIGIGRMVWYVNLSICFLFPASIRVSRTQLTKYMLIFIIVIYCLLYSYTAYFGDSFRGDFMIPYENIYFKLDN